MLHITLEVTVKNGEVPAERY